MPGWWRLESLRWTAPSTSAAQRRLNLNWLLARGLRGHGLDAAAERLDEATLRLVAGAGMFEYFDPLTGEGRGSANFSWTAAVLLDILGSRSAGVT